MTQPITSQRRRLAPPAGLALLAGVALIAAAALLAWGLNMRRGLNHDEHQFVASGALLAREGLLPYRDFPYFHVPVLTLVYALLFQLTPYLLLAARAFAVVCSVLLLALLLLLALRGVRTLSWAGRFGLGAAAVVLLMASPSYLHASGRAWNHDLPVLLTALAACLFARHLAGPQAGHVPNVTDKARPRRRGWQTPGGVLLLVGLLLGLAAGTRSSFLLVAPAFALATLWPRRKGWRAALADLGWLALGGLVGLAPTLYLFALAPEDFLFGNWRYAALNTAYYAASAAPPPAMSLGGKLLTSAQLVAGQGGNLLLVLVTAVMVAAALWPAGGAARRTAARHGAAPLRFALLLLPFLVAGAFAPTPLQEQYLYPLFVWCAFTLVLAVGALGDRSLTLPGSDRDPAGADLAVREVGRQTGRLRSAALLGLVGVAALAAASLAALRYAEGLQVAFVPAEWEPLKVHAQGERLAQWAGGERVLTLAPILPLEGGAAVYPELVSGPLGFRVAALMAGEGMGLLGPAQLEALFAEDPPRAVLTGVHDSDSVEEAPLVALAEAGGYVPISEQEPALLWTRPLAAFGAAIRLGAVDLPLQALAAGEELLLTFAWQAVQPLDRNWSVLVRLVAPGTTDLARSEGWPLGRPTSEWRPGDVWLDGHRLQIGADAAPGPYRLEASFYDPETLELLGEGPAALGFVVVEEAQAGAAASAPLAQFGDCLQLLAVNLPPVTEIIPSASHPPSWQPGTTQEVALTWQRTGRTCGRYTVFVHLAGAQGLAAQVDQEPWRGFFPTDSWPLGVAVTERYALTLPPDLPAGSYQLLVGLYDAANGQRLPVVQGGAGAGDAFLAATVEVTGEATGEGAVDE